MDAQKKEPADFGKIQDFMAKKHNLAIVRELLSNQHGAGFNSIAKKVPGITPRVLSTRLKELELAGVIKKNLVMGAKPKIEYLATLKAEGLRKAITELEKWGKR